MRRDRKIEVRQRDQSDCGPACLASVMSFYGLRISVARIRQEAGTDQKGTSMWGLIKALEYYKFESKGLRGSMDHLSQLPLPFIAHTEQENGMNHYVCVYGIQKKGLRVMDPADGRISRWGRVQFEKRWSGAVVVLARGITRKGCEAEFSEKVSMTGLLKPLWKPLFQAFLTALFYTVLGLSSSLYIGKLSDYVFVTHNTGLLNLMSLVMVLVVLSMIYLSVVKNVITLKTGQVIDNQIIASYYRHIFSLPQPFFDSMKTGEILSRISDAVKIRGFINDAMISICVNILIVLFSFLTMFFLHWKLALMMLGMLPLYLLIYLLYNRQNRLFERRVMEQSASLESFLVESLQSSALIKQHQLKKRMQQGAEKKLNRLLDTLYRSGMNSILASGSSELINRLFTLTLLWIGSYFVIRQHITPGKLISFYALLGYFTGPVASLIGANKTYQNALIAADRLFEIFQLKPEQAQNKPSFLKSDFGDIVLHKVCFAYGTRGEIFRNLNLKIKAGKVTAIKGASGSGKSTLASIIRHLYSVSSGSITINGYDTRHFSVESIRALMGVVPQQIRFLTGSILENIAPGEADPDVKRILDLLKAVGLIPFIESLPMGLSTRLSENGSNFSGGERQRLALVRALYPKPMLLILDEATSSLDPEAAICINRICENLRKEAQTILLITHNAQRGGFIDQTLILENGHLR